MIIFLVMLIVGLALLVKGADLFVDGAARLARGANVSALAVGLTVVAFGSSVPELFVSVAAAISGDTGMLLGNVVGSNIVDCLFILGVSALVRPLAVSRGTVWKAIPFSLLAGGAVWVMAGDMTGIDGYFFSAISRCDGLLLLGYFGVFLVYTVAVAAPVPGLPYVAPILPGRLGAVAIKILLGFCGLLFGGRLMVDGAVGLANMVAMPERVFGLTVVAVGTSLPELVTSVMAARKGETEIAVGNVVGSTVFNGFFILGVSTILRPVPFDPPAHVDMAVMTAASILLFVFLFAGPERGMGRREGALAVLFYCLYVGFLLF